MSQVTKDQILEKIIAVFRENGYEGASLSILSKATGLGRSSLYHHFPKGKEDMAREALDSVMSSFEELVLAPLSHTQHKPERRLKSCSKGLLEFYEEGNRSCLLNIFSVGSAEKMFQKRLKTTSQSLISIFSELVIESGIPKREAEKRAERLVISIQGALVLSRTLQSKEPFQRIVKELPKQLLDQG